MSARSAPRIGDLPTVSATSLKNGIADVFAQVAARGAVAITRHDKARAVLLSVEEYEELVGPELPGLAGLKADYQTMLDRMQAPEQKAAALRAFNASPEELGRAAVAGARRRAEKADADKER